MQNGSKPEGKSLTTVLQAISGEKSAATRSHRGFNERAWQSGKVEKASPAPSAVIRLPPVARLRGRSRRHCADPDDRRQISRSAASTPDQTWTSAGGREARTNLPDWRRSFRFKLAAPRLFERTRHFSPGLKGLICHPVQSKFNASNYRGRQGGGESRQSWSEEGLAGEFCYASGPFNRVVICCCWCWGCLCGLINGKLPSLRGRQAALSLNCEERHRSLRLF